MEGEIEGLVSKDCDKEKLLMVISGDNVVPSDEITKKEKKK
jgi:hypothetical protein